MFKRHVPTVPMLDRETITALCAMGIGKSNANDGIGAPITVPVTACATTGVARAR